MNPGSLRIAFAGTPHFAAKHLNALLQQNFNIVAVFTQPDRPSGRGKRLTASPVKTLAKDHNIDVIQPHHFDDSEHLPLLKSLQLDLMIVVAYGLLIPQSILDLPRFGCINVHASLLPRWRGAAPIERSILNGDDVTGISIMQMDAGLDTGAILYSEACPILIDQDCEKLTNNLTDLGCKGLLHILPIVVAGELSPVSQINTFSTYAKKLVKLESLIYWHSSAIPIQRQINAFFPRMPAYSFLSDLRIRFIESSPLTTTFTAPPGTIVNISKQGITIACVQSSLLLTKLQLPGKSITTVNNLLNGNASLFQVGDIFTSAESVKHG